MFRIAHPQYHVMWETKHFRELSEEECKASYGCLNSSSMIWPLWVLRVPSMAPGLCTLLNGAAGVTGGWACPFSLPARYTYASEMLKFRVRQVKDFYAPALMHIEQSRSVYVKLKWTLERARPEIRLDDFRLLAYIYEFKHSDTPMQPLVNEILAIGSSLTKLLIKHSGLIEGGVTETSSIIRPLYDFESHRGPGLRLRTFPGLARTWVYTHLLNRAIREGLAVAPQ